MIDAIIGPSPAVLIGLTVVLFGGCAFLMGQAVARGWRPASRVVVYGALLALADRFLTYALFEGELLSPIGLISHTIILIAIGLTAYRLTLAYKMVTQYPWLYEPAGLFGWRPRTRGGA